MQRPKKKQIDRKPKRKEIDPILKARRKLANEIAKECVDFLVKNDHVRLPQSIDMTGLADHLLLEIPMNRAEAQAEWDRFDTEYKERKAEIAPGPSIIDRLRDALGCSALIDLRGVIESAINFINAHKGPGECKSSPLTEAPNEQSSSDSAPTSSS